MLGIVGKTGAGKTTIVNLLMRFYELNSGDIKIDGISIKDMKYSKKMLKVFARKMKQTIVSKRFNTEMIFVKNNFFEFIFYPASIKGIFYFYKKWSSMLTNKHAWNFFKSIFYELLHLRN